EYSVTPGQYTLNIYEPWCNYDNTSYYLCENPQIPEFCQPITSATFFIQPYPVINSLTWNNNNICPGTSTTISAVVNDPSAILTWTSNPPDPSIGDQINNLQITIQPTVTTTYTLTMENSCDLVTQNITITVIPVPTADFNISSTCISMSAPVNFVNTSQPLTGIQSFWDFGDYGWSGNTNPSHTYINYGNFCVSLIATNQCGSDSYTEQIYIYPEQCACPQTGDIPDGYEVGINEIWTSEHIIAGDVIIPSNRKLTIEMDVIIRFRPQGRIVVERNGILELKKRATLTSLGDPCNYMWEGVEVWGYGNLESSSPLHGKFIMNQGAVIENAHIGVLLGRKNECYICKIGICKNVPYTSAYSGGIIDAQQAIFRNNGTSIRFINKENVESSYNIIYNCQFIGGLLLDGNYIVFSNYSYPNENNPYYGYANYDCRSATGIELYGVSDIQIEGNAFNNIEIGIRSLNAKYDVINNNHFTNCRYGIFIDNSFSSINFSHTIFGNLFANIHATYSPQSDYSACIFIRGGRYDNIIQNRFGNLVSTQSVNSKGIWLDNTSF
ncbi:MAG: PKD domain-containing protein, partial [Bacteroidia bacterium]|nr:PKD domain-containing protein [Bacteroidia bacterium]